ncbi:DMT family transporter [Alisedimentitalea sp. MJ-SS2]|uniref:DMT family transporter n=1 Tax=Aliisedimentitalea sp. MJ-SS2 TaxID=3049795 RepID=UPI0029088044|nr:DMT family transporter [Alisedimentitalea sp. MJ-SS2]MDU8926485.1 DMT family transporter [Alisedimentitalea sp. MJ-SS2]
MRSLSPKATAILLMIAAIFMFSSMDALAKLLAGRIGTMPTLWARYLGQTLVVFILVLPRLRSVLRTRYPKLQLARSVYLMCATVLFFFGISNIGLAEAAAIMSTNPLFITLGAAVFLGETFGLRRAFAILAACIGAFLVIRPGADVFTLYSLLPLGAAICYSAYALTTRFVGRDEDAWTSLFYTALFGAIALSAAVPFFWQPVAPGDLIVMLAIALCGTAGQLALIRALMAGEAGMLAPFAYFGLVFSTFYGATIFGDFPDTLTILGGLIIAGAGIYVWYRETVIKPD